MPAPAEVGTCKREDNEPQTSDLWRPERLSRISSQLSTRKSVICAGRTRLGHWCFRARTCADAFSPVSGPSKLQRRCAKRCSRRSMCILMEVGRLEETSNEQVSAWQHMRAHKDVQTSRLDKLRKTFENFCIHRFGSRHRPFNLEGKWTTTIVLVFELAGSRRDV